MSRSEETADYKDKREEIYDAEIFKGDVDTIHAWVSGKTTGTILFVGRLINPAE